MNAGRVAHLLARMTTMKYFPWRNDESKPFCRWSTRDGCDCTVDPIRPTAEIEDGVKIVLSAIVEAMETICLGVPFAVEQLDELWRRTHDLGESGEAVPSLFLAHWHDQRLRPLVESAWAILAHASLIDDRLREIERLSVERDPCPTSSDRSVPDGHAVYLIGAPGFLKIGHNSNLETRFAGLQSSAPLDLSLIGVLKGSRRLERDLHQRFAAHRLRGEWYREVPDIRDFFARDYRRIELLPEGAIPK